MARIRPFAGWRYADRGTDLSAVTAPPYDVLSAEQRSALIAEDPHNVVQLELPDGPLDPDAEDGRYQTGARTWAAWRETGVLAEDARPCVYVLEQHYHLGEREVRRRAFIVEVGLEPFEEGVVLPHERTLPKALGDRFELIKATGANFSQVFGLFDDPACETDAIFTRIMASEPVAIAEDADGVVSRLWADDDAEHAGRLAHFLADGRIFIADGHHRYTTALAYRDLRRAQEAAKGAEVTGDAPYDFVMMALVNMDDPDLVVLPTHRVADAPGHFDPVAFVAGLEQHFVIEPLEQSRAHGALDDIAEPAMIVKLRGESPFLARLRPDVDPDTAIPLERSRAWKNLDVAVLQELVLDPLLGIHPDRPETLERLHFYKEAHAAMKATAEHDVAFVLRATRMDQLRSVALAGETMPQKSTYFYPKLLSGLVFRAAE